MSNFIFQIRGRAVYHFIIEEKEQVQHQLQPLTVQ